MQGRWYHGTLSREHASKKPGAIHLEVALLCGKYTHDNYITVAAGKRGHGCRS